MVSPKRASLQRTAVVTEHWNVKKISDLIFMIMPRSCPSDRPEACDSCEHATVEYKSKMRSWQSVVEIGYVSCIYSPEEPKPVGLSV
jgi:hypothetical protein